MVNIPKTQSAVVFEEQVSPTPHSPHSLLRA